MRFYGIIESSTNAKSPRVISTGDMAQSKGDSTMLPQYTPTDKDIQRFWKKVDKSGGPDACWLWLAGGTGGYGRFGYRHIQVSAHRFVWLITHGPVPEGLEVCHRCDNPRCVNPAHLFVATHYENMMDCVKKQRLNRAYGERHGIAKLTNEQVLEIRRRYAEGGITMKQLGKEYGVSGTAISFAIRGINWAKIK